MPPKDEVLDIPEMEPAEGVSWDDPDPVYQAVVFRESLIQAGEYMTAILTNLKVGFVQEMLPLDLAFGAYAVAIDKLMNELNDARVAALRLKAMAIEADEAKEA